MRVEVSAGFLGLTQVCILTGGLGRSRHVPLRARAGYAPNRLQDFAGFRWLSYIRGPSIRFGFPLPRSFKSLGHKKRAYRPFSNPLMAYQGPLCPSYERLDGKAFQSFLEHLSLFYKIILKRSLTVRLM